MKKLITIFTTTTMFLLMDIGIANAANCVWQIETISLIVSASGIFIGVIGWFYNQKLNRKNEIAKEMRERRTRLLEDFIKFKELYREIEKEKEKEEKEEKEKEEREKEEREKKLLMYNELSSNITAMIILCGEEEETRVWMNIHFSLHPLRENTNIGDRVKLMSDLEKLLIINTGKKYLKKEINLEKIINQAI